jgi:hypothetical protein
MLFASFEKVEWDRACDTCLAPRAINLAYFAARDPLTEPNARAAQSLEHVAALRYGHLWRCRVCGRPWYDAEGGLCSSVERSWVPVLERWSAKPLEATTKHVELMRAIGAVEWNSKAVELRIPCRVRRGQTWYDPTLTIFQNRPLLMWKNPAPEVFGIHEVEDITPTEFALPYELRKRGANALEKAMGYAPHSAYWGDTQVPLNGLVEFWGIGGQMGMDLSMRSPKGDWQPRAQNPRALANHPLTYVIGDVTAQMLSFQSDGWRRVRSK